MTFEFDGEKYKKASDHQKEWGRKLISEFEFKGNERILDLGCGDGGLTARLAELVPEGMVVGIDSSEGMIETSRKNIGDNLKFELMDINSLAFNNEFDLVFSNATLHWIKDHKKLLSNVFNILNKDGIVRFQFAADGNCSHFFKVIRQVMAEKKYAEYFSDFEWPWYMPKIDEYKKLLAQSDFKEKKVWAENADRFFPDVDAMVGWVDQPSLVPFLKCIEEKDRKCFRDIVVNRMIQETIQDDGTCFETFRRINVYAKK